MVLDLDRLKAERGRDGWWDPSRRDLWRFGGLLAARRRRPRRSPPHRHPRRGVHALASPTPIPWPSGPAAGSRSRTRGGHHPGFGANPTLSFKDRGMAMTVSMARALGLTRLAVPTQGNAGDSLAEYAVAGGIEAAIVMSPDTDLPVLGKVAAYAAAPPGTRPRSSWSPARSSTAAGGSASITSRRATSAWRRSRSRAGGPRGRRRSAWRWPSRPATAWPTGAGSSPT